MSCHAAATVRQRRHPRLGASSPGEKAAPRSPVVHLPSLGHALIIVGRHVEVHEVDPSVLSLRNEGREDVDAVDKRGMTAESVTSIRTKPALV
jgi:hypothetical protein